MLFRSDRKSTRLNSSHTIISYAVFCLKKKKTSLKPTDAVCRATPAPRPLHRGVCACRGARKLRCRSLVPNFGGRGQCFFFLNDTAPPELYPLPLPAALPI